MNKKLSTSTFGCILLLLFISIGCGTTDSDNDNDIMEEDPQTEFISYSPVESNRATLVASMPLVDESKTDSVFIRDLWGFVVENEKYIAVSSTIETDNGLADFNLHIVNVSNTENPILTSKMEGINAQDIKFWNNYLYTVTGAHEENGGKVINVSDPSNPVLTGNFDSAHNIFIDQKGFLYVTGASTRIFELNTDPENPKFLSTLDGVGSHDITVIDDKLYIFSGRDEPNVLIYGVSPEGTASLFTDFSSEHIFFSHSGWPTVDGNYLIVTDEFAIDNEADFTIWDISQGTPALVNGFFDSDATVHNVMINGDYAYMSYYSAGFRIFDISDPEHPVLIGEVDTSPFEGEVVTARTENSVSLNVKGAWGIFSKFDDGYAYISDVNTGLHIIKIE